MHSDFATLQAGVVLIKSQMTESPEKAQEIKIVWMGDKQIHTHVIFQIYAISSGRKIGLPLYCHMQTAF